MLSGASLVQGLQRWCAKQCEGYPGVEIRNMHSSWRDGLAFCAIIHRYRPDLIDFASLKPGDVRTNNELAFRVARDNLGIPDLLEVDDMERMKVPDQLSIVTYVSFYHNYFGKIAATTSASKALQSGKAAEIKSSVEASTSLKSTNTPQKPANQTQAIASNRSPLTTNSNVQPSISVSKNISPPSVASKNSPAMLTSVNLRPQITTNAAEKTLNVTGKAQPLAAKTEESESNKRLSTDSTNSQLCFVCKQRVHLLDRYTLDGIGQVCHKSCALSSKIEHFSSVKRDRELTIKRRFDPASQTGAKQEEPAKKLSVVQPAKFSNVNVTATEAKPSELDNQKFTKLDAKVASDNPVNNGLSKSTLTVTLKSEGPQTVPKKPDVAIMKPSPLARTNDQGNAKAQSSPVESQNKVTLTSNSAPVVPDRPPTRLAPPSKPLVTNNADFSSQGQVKPSLLQGNKTQVNKANRIDQVDLEQQKPSMRPKTSEEIRVPPPRPLPPALPPRVSAVPSPVASANVSAKNNNFSQIQLKEKNSTDRSSRPATLLCRRSVRTTTEFGGSLTYDELLDELSDLRSRQLELEKKARQLERELRGEEVQCVVSRYKPLELSLLAPSAVSSEHESAKAKKAKKPKQKQKRGQSTDRALHAGSLSDKLVSQWFALVSERAQLHAQESELMAFAKMRQLDDLHADVEFDLRCLQHKRLGGELSDAEQKKEKELFLQLTRVVDERAQMAEEIISLLSRHAQEESNMMNAIAKNGAKF